MTTFKRFAITVFLGLSFATAGANSTTLQIDQTQSSFSKNDWFCNTDCNASAQYQLSGTFELAFDNWYGVERIFLQPIALATTEPDVEPFSFPIFPLVYEDGTFWGNGNPCNFWDLPGTCYSEGNFGGLSGEFDGVNLRLTGAAPISRHYSYHYTIAATVVPTATAVKAVPIPGAVTVISILSIVALAYLKRGHLILTRSKHGIDNLAG